MKIIREPSCLQGKLSEYYAGKSPKGVKLSNHTHFQKVNADCIIAYSFISDVIIALTQEEYISIQEETESLKNAIIASLSALGFYVSSEVHEQDVQKAIRQGIFEVSSDAVKFVILPTTNCNAGCSYCISGKNQKQDMTHETALSTIKFVNEASRAYKKVLFSWYGGEPLLGRETITLICNEFRRKNPNKWFSSSFSSNLVEMSDDALRTAIDVWNTTKIYVTFDGYKGKHNDKKGYSKSDFDGYGHSINIIEKLLEKGVQVNCRFNIDKTNIKELDLVVKDIKRFTKSESFHFFVQPLRSEDKNAGFYTYEEFGEIQSLVDEILTSNGIIPPVDSLVPKRAMKGCLAKSRHCNVIGADGNIFRCNLGNLTQSNSTGNIHDGVAINEVYRYFTKCDLDEECIKCKFLPICQGGCPERRINISSTTSHCTAFKFKIEQVSKTLAKYYAG